MKGSLALIIIVVLVVWGVAAQGHSSQSQGAVTRASSPVKRHPRKTMHYTAAEHLLIDSVDIAAGKAMQAAGSPDGLYERRTSQEWCGMALDAESALVRRHSLAWAAKVDRAHDAESQKFQLAAKACG